MCTCDMPKRNINACTCTRNRTENESKYLCRVIETGEYLGHTKYDQKVLYAADLNEMVIPERLINKKSRYFLISSFW